MKWLSLNQNPTTQNSPAGLSAPSSRTRASNSWIAKPAHSIQGGYNQYSPSSPAVKQHNTSAQTGGRGCFTCHDGKQHYGRAVFSGDDAQFCGKCHNLQGDIKVFKVRG